MNAHTFVHVYIRYEYKAEDLSKFAKWEEGKSYTRNLVHQGGDHQSCELWNGWFDNLKTLFLAVHRQLNR